MVGESALIRSDPLFSGVDWPATGPHFEVSASTPGPTTPSGSLAIVRRGGLCVRGGARAAMT